MTRKLSTAYKNEGLAGWLEDIELRRRKNPRLNSIYEFDQKNIVVFKFLNDLAKLEKGIPKYSLNSQTAKFLHKLKINTAVYSDITNKNFQDRRGLLIYGVNHNAFIEPIILFSLLKQKNVKLILYRFYYYFSKNLQKFALPVAAKTHAYDRGFHIKKYFDVSYKFLKSENLLSDINIAENDKSLKDAVKTLETGGIVVIFPGGSGNELTKWRFGISRIIMSIHKDKRDKISLLPVYFSGMGSIRMLLRLIKAYKNITQSSLRVGVYFGRERTIANVYQILGNKISEENILKYLKKDAFTQYGLKEKPLKIYLHPKNYPLAVSKSLAFSFKVLIQIIPLKEFFRS